MVGKLKHPSQKINIHTSWHVHPRGLRWNILPVANGLYANDMPTPYLHIQLAHNVAVRP